ncbi:hypothetical protein DSBG_2022 [Desulfosporosinus sp. BG]|nr:hypothetical protein DSBG_2022 [Desulfosporosinus sp. BG]
MEELKDELRHNLQERMDDLKNQGYDVGAALLSRISQVRRIIFRGGICH